MEQARTRTGSIGLMLLRQQRLRLQNFVWTRGNLSSVKWFRGIGEYRIDWGPGYRIYLAKDGLKIIVLLGGGTKRAQQRDIERAVALWNDYKRRKAKETKPR